MQLVGCVKALLRHPSLLLLAIALSLSGCGPREPSPEEKAYRQKLEQCRTELGKSSVVPIIGGGQVDLSRFGYAHPSVRYEDGQCGTDLIEVLFWWTGTEVIPDSPRFLEGKVKNTPSSWQYFKVNAAFGNQRKARQCKENIDLPQCSGYKGRIRPGLKVSEWPPEFTIRLKNYPGLEIWLKDTPPSADNLYRVSDFILTEWRRQDGTPRTIDCWGLRHVDASTLRAVGLDTSRLLDASRLVAFTREELENLDLQGRVGKGAACQVDFDGFGFEAGAARVSFSTESLREAPAALKALNDYLRESIIADVEHEAGK